MPEPVRGHLVERMRDRSISADDLARLMHWAQSAPEVPAGDGYKDFDSFKLCGRGSLPKTFLLKGQAASGQKL